VTELCTLPGDVVPPSSESLCQIAEARTTARPSGLEDSLETGSPEAEMIKHATSTNSF
jgi:hypothetical protein